jgi:hypothetical protein
MADPNEKWLAQSALPHGRLFASRAILTLPSRKELAVIDTDSPQNAFAAIYSSASRIPTLPTAAPPADAETARWAKNIFLWSSYLPHDCVQSMIRMGWHHST